MVPREGLEPPRLAATDFESAASSIPPPGHISAGRLVSVLDPFRPPFCRTPNTPKLVSMTVPARDLHARSDWTREEIAALFALPFPDLIFRAATVHRAHFDPGQVQTSTLLSIKTGGCPEGRPYCSHWRHSPTRVQG